MAGEWDRKELVPVDLPDGATVDVKLWFPLAEVRSDPSRLAPNPGIDPAILADRLGGDEFFRLCMLNAAALFENNYAFLKLKNIRIGAR